MSEQIMQQKFNVKLPTENFEQILKIGSTLVEELRFNYTEEGISIRTMDPSHVGLIDISLPSILFEKYETTRGNFALRVDHALKIVKQFDKDSTINLEIKNDKMIFRDHELSYELAIIEASDNDTPLPKVIYDSLISLPTKEAKKYLAKIEVVSDYITLKTVNDKAEISGIGDNGNCKIVLQKGMEQLLQLKINNESKGTYSLEYIAPYLKSMIGNYVQTFEFSTEKPLRISTKIFSNSANQIGHCYFYLAPRVTD